MALSILSVQCREGPERIGDLTLVMHADHDACPGGFTRPGVLGGWVCSCPCHKNERERAVLRGNQT